MGHHPLCPRKRYRCDEDVAAFDGWYTDRAAAAAVMQHRIKRFPYWIAGGCTRIKFGSVLVIIRCFADERKYFASEASVYRLLKAHDIITSSADVVIKAANGFKDKTTAIKITGWGWYYLSTVLDDFSRYIVDPSRAARSDRKCHRL